MKAVWLSLTLALAGCASPLPRQHWQSTDEALVTLSARAHHIQSIRATATLILTSPDNQRVTLDAAILAKSASEESHLLRIRAWKFSQAVLDLTARPDGVWIASDSKPDAPPPDERLQSLKPAQISDAWNLFFGDFFSAPGLKITVPPGPVFTAQRIQDSTTVICDIDKATLTPREYRILDDAGRLRQTLTLARYQLQGDPPAPWPMQLIAQGDQGRIEVRFDDVEINPELDDAVFTPPRRAIKQ